ncbi:MAG: protein kinase, partial [Planctomycetota bacterium]
RTDRYLVPTAPGGLNVKRRKGRLEIKRCAGIYGVEEQDSGRYLVLEFVEGESLAERLDRGPLPVDESIELAAQIAAGVEAAHEAGVIHRDLKPANIMITPDGQAKVLDFGLARSDEGRSTSVAPDAATLTSPAPHSPTMVGAILGTAAYMSPEQARGRRIDKRTDIWSFGVVLYEMLTGASPFVGETASDSIGAVLHKSFDFDRLPSGTPAHVRGVVERCLQRDKAMRYRDIGDARLDLIRAPAEHTAPTASDRSVMPMVVAFTAVILGLVGALTLTMLAKPSAPQTIAASTVHATILAPEGFRLSSAVISNDARHVVLLGDIFDAERGDASFRDIAFARELSSDRLRRIDGINDPVQAAFSPDGKWIVFATRSDREVLCDLYRLPADLTGTPTRILSIPYQTRVAGRSWFSWTPDSELAYIDSGASELVVSSAGTGEELRRVAISSEEASEFPGSFLGPFGDSWVAVSDPGVSEVGYAEDILLINTRTGEGVRAVRNAGSPVLFGGDRLLFSRGTQIFEARFDTDALAIDGAIRPVYDGLATINAWSNGEFDVSNTGVLVHMPGGRRGTQRSIVQVDAEFNESVWSDEKRSFEQEVAISPDGERIAVTLSNPGGLFEVWVADRATPRFRRLLAAPGFDMSFSTFTADGEHVIAVRALPDADGDSQILRARFDGRGEPEVIYQGGAMQFAMPESVGSDGRTLLASVASPQGDRRYIEIPLDSDDNPREITGLHTSAYSFDHAPGGLPLICYLSTESGSSRLYVRELRDGVLGTPYSVSDEDVLAASWYATTENGAVLSYLGADRSVRVRDVAVEGGIRIGESRLIHRDGSIYLDVAFAPDVGGVAIKRGDDEGPITRVDIVTNWLNALR